ncbi:MAG: hypothetical protein OJF49_002476 [Ktedonobacterales bacterium]|jgi:DNA-binding NtrC family response regulator|nr:MAG: hypothetical protein OJF49_002476 [Ktedonobacterales bacterium]
MAHVLIYSDDEAMTNVLEMSCVDEGHSVTVAQSAEAALMALRSSLHPIVTILDSGALQFTLKHTLAALAADHVRYGEHRYIAIYYSSPREEERALLEELAVAVLGVPFDLSAVSVLIAEAAASFGG